MDIGYTVCSAIVEENGRVLLKNTPHGISLLGGYVDWSLGFPACLVQGVLGDHEVLIHPWHVNGIYQNSSPTGRWLTNINVYATVDDERNARDIVWVAKEDIPCAGIRTPDVRFAIDDLSVGSYAELPFVHVTSAPSALQSSLPLEKADTRTEVRALVVSSVVIQHMDGDYLFVRCRKGGKLSLVGGKLNEGEGISSSLEREVAEEIHAPVRPIGIIGAYVNPIPGVGWVTNIATYARTPQKDIPIEPNEEITEAIWIPKGQLVRMDPEEFRTPDAVRAVIHSEYLRKTKGLLPLSFVRKITGED